MSFQKNMFITSPKEKKLDPYFRYIPVHYILIMRGYMVDGYEMEDYE